MYRLIRNRKLEKCRDEFALKNVFYFLKERQNLYPYMKYCDLYVQPSGHERYGLTNIWRVSGIGGVSIRLKNHKEINLKLCFAASSGGHLEEIARLKQLARKDDFVLTEDGACTSISWCDKVYRVHQINRKEPTFIPKFIALFFTSVRVLLKENPDVVISTGALATIPICICAKLMRKKVIYIESFARVDDSSITGKCMYKIADLFIVQWKEMKKVFPKAVYGGAIF